MGVGNVCLHTVFTSAIKHMEGVVHVAPIFGIHRSSFALLTALEVGSCSVEVHLEHLPTSPSSLYILQQWD